MKKILSLILALGLVFSFTACGGDEPSTGQGTEEATSTTAETPKKEPAEEPASDNALGDFVVVLGEATQATDMDGANALLVSYDFTNNGSETNSSMAALYVQAFQDGVELQHAYFMDYPSADWETWVNNDMLEIQTGASIKVAQGFKLTSSSPVEVQVTELISFSDKKVTNTYEVQ